MAAEIVENDNFVWSCITCTYDNQADAKTCDMCGSNKPTQKVDDRGWQCILCTFINNKTAIACQICGGPSPLVNDLTGKQICISCTTINLATARSCSLCEQPLNNTTIKIDHKINLEMFLKKISLDKCDSKDNCSNPIQACDAVNRIVHSLKYYDQLNIISNTMHQKTFDEFINEIYIEILNDYIHLHKVHSHQLQIINEILPDCVIGNCQYCCRHHQTDINRNNDNPSLNFYSNMMDSLHFYLYHCFDVGLRTKTLNANEIEEREEKKDDKYFDEAFARINKQILETQRITKSFSRLSNTKNNKFNLAINDEQIDDESNDNNTDLDDIYEHLENHKVQENYIMKLKEFIENQEYDTDSIEYDLDIGNISKHVENNKCIDTIKDLFKAAKVASSSFSIGLRFYYWNYYKELTELSPPPNTGGVVSLHNNYNDHSGHRVCDLFITPRYNSFKEEICYYKYITMKQYKTKAIVKVRKYMNATIVKQTTAFPPKHGYYSKHYSIKKGDPLTFSHLLCLVFYCDYSGLCSHFSGTFRKKNKFETLDSIKKRNSKYYFFSKILREVVECYGQNRISGLSGPYYCGLNKEMSIPQFNVRLCSPTSTSIHIEVAIKFSTEEGMILQFNNPLGSGHRFLTGFDVSWISTYSEEDERLFFGGFYCIKIESVRLRSTKQNFEVVMSCLYYLDLMISGGEALTLKISSSNVSLIKHLLSYNSHKSTKRTLDNYVYFTFTAFIQSKKQIIFDLWRLSVCHPKIMCLFMHPLDPKNLIKEKNIQRADDDFCNVIRPEMFLIFKNVTSIIINTTAFPPHGERGDLSYSFSMTRLLSVVVLTGLHRVIIKADTSRNCKDDNCSNWINSLWCSDKSSLKQTYAAQKYDICVKRINNGQYEQYWFIINKQN